MEGTYCDREKLHEAAVRRVKEDILSPQEVDRICKIYAVLSDPTRMKIVLALRRGGMCVYHLAEVTGITVSGVSHQLRVLKEQNVVKAKRLGKNMEYSIADEHIQKIIDIGLAHLRCALEE